MPKNDPIKVLLFTKNNEHYFPFIDKLKEDCTLKIVYPNNHPRIKDNGFENFKQECIKFSADILVSFYYNRVIQSTLLDKHRLSINFHGSLLPDYAGSHALNWQLINGENVSGVTIHELTNKIDGGKIFLQKDFQIEFDEDANDVLRKGVTTSCKMWDVFLKKYRDNDLHPVEQSKEKIIFECSKRSDKDGEITKNMNPIDIYNLSRALPPPWPRPFYYTEQQKKVKLSYPVSLEKAERIYQVLNGERK
jgi:methionyl-tRNA formyltransferase